MCFVCDGIAEPCGWQRAVDLVSHFAGLERAPCGMCDDEFDEFVTKLGLNCPTTCSIGCQIGDSALTLVACQESIEGEPGRAPPLERVLPIGTVRKAHIHSPAGSSLLSVP